MSRILLPEALTDNTIEAVGAARAAEPMTLPSSTVVSCQVRQELSPHHSKKQSSGPCFKLPSEIPSLVPGDFCWSIKDQNTLWPCIILQKRPNLKVEMVDPIERICVPSKRKAQDEEVKQEVEEEEEEGEPGQASHDVRGFGLPSNIFNRKDSLATLSCEPNSDPVSLGKQIESRIHAFQTDRYEYLIRLLPLSDFILDKWMETPWPVSDYEEQANDLLLIRPDNLLVPYTFTTGAVPVQDDRILNKALIQAIFIQTSWAFPPVNESEFEERNEVLSNLSSLRSTRSSTPVDSSLSEIPPDLKIAIVESKGF
jgi:hypothetical protein